MLRKIIKYFSRKEKISRLNKNNNPKPSGLCGCFPYERGDFKDDKWPAPSYWNGIDPEAYRARYENEDSGWEMIGPTDDA
ncbi:MAG: hypothetical protein PVJ67_02785 [Candidatus Pacearchaeota archaeon]|jgi:hypothetical protein